MATPNIEQLLADAKTGFVESVLGQLDDYGAEDRLNAVRAIAAELYDRDSDRLAAILPLGGDTLTGRYFRAPDPKDTSAEAAWLDGEACQVVEGMVIGQPFTSPTSATYLVEFYGQHGASGYQQLIELDRMREQRWAFYDTAAWLTSRQSAGKVAGSHTAAVAQEHAKGGE